MKEAVLLEGAVDVFIGKDEVATRVVVDDDILLVVEGVGDTEPELFRFVLAELGNTRPEFEAEGWVQAEFFVEAVSPTWVQGEIRVGVAAVGAKGKDSVSICGYFLDDLWVGTIVGADFAVVVYGVECDFRFRGVEGLEGRKIRFFAYDLHFFGVALSKVADNAGQAIVVAEAKVAKEEEPHFFDRGRKGAICYRCGKV